MASKRIIALEVTPDQEMVLKEVFSKHAWEWKEMNGISNSLKHQCVEENTLDRAMPDHQEGHIECPH